MASFIESAASAASGGPSSSETSLYTDFMTRASELSTKSKKIYKGKNFETYAVTDQNIKIIIEEFSYPTDGDKSTVMDNKNLINAFFANDLYKLSMAPVIDKCSKDTKGCVVQFKLDLRTESTFNEPLKEFVITPEFSTTLAKELDKFKSRLFDQPTLESVITSPGPIWKEYWLNGHKDLILGKPLIEIDRNEIFKNFTKFDGTELTDENFHEDTIVLNCIPKPKNSTQPSNVVLSVSLIDGSLDVRATGSWQLCSFLETPIMQCVYEVLHRQYLKDSEKTYGAWLAEALYRTFSGMSFLESKDIKVALFSGRRTGGALFNLLQVYLWNQFDSQFIPGVNQTGKNLGTSSFWALHILKTIVDQNTDNKIAIAPSGTHAHELSMTLATLYPDLDDQEKGFVGSQILGHLLYKYLSAGPTPTPMLTDTVGTGNFLKTSVILLDKRNNNRALCSFASARQDSGELTEYARIVTEYVTAAKCGPMPLLMASEIDDRDTDFEKAIEAGYKLAGVGGALGDSEKIDSEEILGSKFDTNNHFAASMAVKVACVWAGADEKPRYTLKTGDKNSEDKLTYDKINAPQMRNIGKKFQELHQKALENISSEESSEESSEKQNLLDEILDRLIPPPPKGGRRTRKHVRKNTKRNKKQNKKRSHKRK